MGRVPSAKFRSETCRAESAKQIQSSNVGGKADSPLCSSACLSVAEAVEKVGATRIFVTMVHDSGLLRNFDSMTGFALNHSFKNSGTGDFFNNLSHKETCGSQPLSPINTSKRADISRSPWPAAMARSKLLIIAAGNASFTPTSRHMARVSAKAAA